MTFAFLILSIANFVAPFSLWAMAPAPAFCKLHLAGLNSEDRLIEIYDAVQNGGLAPAQQNRQILIDIFRRRVAPSKLLTQRQKEALNALFKSQIQPNNETKRRNLYAAKNIFLAEVSAELAGMKQDSTFKTPTDQNYQFFLAAGEVNLYVTKNYFLPTLNSMKTHLAENEARAFNLIHQYGIENPAFEFLAVLSPGVRERLKEVFTPPYSSNNLLEYHQSTIAQRIRFRLLLDFMDDAINLPQMRLSAIESWLSASAARPVSLWAVVEDLRAAGASVTTTVRFLQGIERMHLGAESALWTPPPQRALNWTDIGAYSISLSRAIPVYDSKPVPPMKFISRPENERLLR